MWQGMPPYAALEPDTKVQIMGQISADLHEFLLLELEIEESEAKRSAEKIAEIGRLDTTKSAVGR